MKDKQKRVGERTPTGVLRKELTVLLYTAKFKLKVEIFSFDYVYTVSYGDLIRKIFSMR